MNPIQILSSQPWVERLGWILIHFLWQGVLIALLYAGARRLSEHMASPNTRYLLACAALALLMAAPVVTWTVTAPSKATPEQAYRIRSIPPDVLGPTGDAAPRSVEDIRLRLRPAEYVARCLPSVVAAWLLGAIAFWVRLLSGWVLAARMRSMLVRPAPPEWQQSLSRLGVRIGLLRPVRLLVSALVQVPTVVGWLRPVVLMPVGALSGLPREQLEALLVHELAHIRRHDYLVNILQSVAEALLFYHPAVWWVSGHLRMQRELCCDAVAVSVTGDALTYARALLEWESCRPARLTAAVAANGGKLAERIARLLGQSRPTGDGEVGPGIAVVTILGAIGACALFGQTADRAAFQVASIKHNTETAPRGMMVRPQPGGRLTASNAPLMLLIQNAYSVQSFQVIGGPAWINSEGYDIEAKPESETDRKQMWLMVQTLLADRFKLALHRDTRELPGYELTLTKGGLKKPEKASECVTLAPDAPLPPPGPGQPGICGYVMIAMGPQGLSMQGGKVPMAELTRVLATVMGRPVIDRTAFRGEFDVHVEFTPDESTMGLPGSGAPHDPGGPRLPTDPSRPTIFAALQEQLGLKLATGKGPVEVLVIDHVERPSAN